MTANRPVCIPGRDRGFTLLELVVALALVAGLLSLLFGGLRLGARMWETVEQRTARLHDQQVAARFVVRQLEQARAVVLQDGNGEERMGFSGTAQGLQFVAPLASRAGPGGLHWLRLDVVVVDERTRRLELSYRLFQSERWERYVPDDGVQTVVLYEALGDVEFGYFGASAPRMSARWLDAWVGKEDLPQLVRLRFRARGERNGWRELIAAPRVTAPLRIELGTRPRPAPGVRAPRELRI